MNMLWHVTCVLKLLEVIDSRHIVNVNVWKFTIIMHNEVQSLCDEAMLRAPTRFVSEMPYHVWSELTRFIVFLFQARGRLYSRHTVSIRRQLTYK